MTPEPSSGRQILPNFSGKLVLILGDVMLDRFVYGDAERISPEAPIPILTVRHEFVMPGGAANVARNVVSMGGRVALIGVVGDDAAGLQLRDLLSKLDGVEADFVVSHIKPTTEKVRYVASRQQILRVDTEDRRELPAEGDEILTRFQSRIADANVVILSDYAKGVLSEHVVQTAIAVARTARTPIVVDPKHKDFHRYDGGTIITPNLRETAIATRMAGDDDESVSTMANAVLMTVPNTQAVLVTRGAQGMTLVERGNAVHHLPAVKKEIFDVSGAGDTVVAMLALSLAAGLSLVAASNLANVAAGIAVSKVGTAAVTIGELTLALYSEARLEASTKLVSLTEALEYVAGWRALGEQIGFTNGCFDLIHTGHISLLSQARRHCTRLIVGLNSDASVRRIKGANRPIQDQNTRGVVLASLAGVDLVVSFDEDTPFTLLKNIRPDILIKGADYTIEQVIGAEFVRSYGGKVMLAELTPNQSTTGIISRIERGSA